MVHFIVKCELSGIVIVCALTVVFYFITAWSLAKFGINR
jgi:hypothetical protein